VDITTVFGLVALAGLITAAIATGQLTRVFLNFHGIGLVGGGSLIALLLNTPWEYFSAAIKAVPSMLSSHKDTVHSQGINALRSVDARIGRGWLARAATVALENNDPDYVRQTLEQEAIQLNEHKNEVINVYRTMGIVSPMFGLIGTLIGIVDVLKHISNPEEVGANMAVAVTTAFYGILLANLVAVPLAGKLRLRYLHENVMRFMVIDAVVEMLKGTVPALLERKLRVYVPEHK
jgi:chemotaxis protein MotA